MKEFLRDNWLWIVIPFVVVVTVVVVVVVMTPDQAASPFHY